MLEKQFSFGEIRVTYIRCRILESDQRQLNN